MTAVEITTDDLRVPTTLGPYRTADYMALPDDQRFELILGRLYVNPSPVPDHQTVALQLAIRLSAIADATNGRCYIAPLDVHLADHSVVQPDVIYVAAGSRFIIQDWIRGAPDLVAEVLSPSTTRRDRNHKLRLYAESGVKEYWLLDPATGQIEFLRNEGGSFVVALPEGDVYRSTKILGIEIDVRAFWTSVRTRR